MHSTFRPFQCGPSAHSKIPSRSSSKTEESIREHIAKMSLDVRVFLRNGRSSWSQVSFSVWRLWSTGGDCFFHDKSTTVC
ncbi:hypothetical protein OESDEN_01265 [Oesophagostomum dentatum]|uniref:Uncharacterized protein n=1 Tax=Oesophagostomum dentatum TaxID=61180 RepID=A0A0B1TND6_OESDE|nr:hypothetical protein OESDEN_01265 [Oesophagostomum dentatum]